MYHDLLKDTYNAEKQLVKALPKMAKAATSEELRNAQQEHLSVTEGRGASFQWRYHVRMRQQNAYAQQFAEPPLPLN